MLPATLFTSAAENLLQNALEKRAVEQNIDIGAFEPQLGQRFERLARMDRLCEKNPINPARTGTGDNVSHHPQPQIIPAFNVLYQLPINDLAARTGP